MFSVDVVETQVITKPPNESIISLHALEVISSPKMLKIRGFIKHKPVVVLIDSGSMHNCFHKHDVKAMHYFVRELSNF